LVERATALPVFEQLRHEVLERVAGRVLEIGFGAGASVRHYTGVVDALVAIDPNPGMFKRARRQEPSTPLRIRLVRGDAESLPLGNGRFDAAVSLLTLCSVSDPARVLKEVHRVLRPGGHLHLLEHGLSSDAGVARWQHRLTPLQRIGACGCRLNRPIADLVEGHGFHFVHQRTFFAPGLPRIHGWLTLGTATRSDN